MATYELTYDGDGRPILPEQHPEAEFPYLVSFENQLSKYGDGDTIDFATVTADRGITIYSVVYNETAVIFWAKDGVAKNKYNVLVKATTVGGKVLPYELIIPFGYNQVVLESYE